MPLGLTMHGKWDGISMASPQLHSYKHDRPAYSTPQPVENTPANNECRMVELRGAKVASFYVGGDEFICLPQAFDLFLKHLVGGLHTVYTKLKRLSISPVVCNVEQVRILRGLGAIQPGVNRCKLITRKDFEILYQDCTQASRPGRPPKRYPMLPPTTDLMSHHGGMRAMNPAHGILSPADLSSLHKRMRFDTETEKHLQQHQERRMSNSPSKDSPPMSDKDINSNDMHSNAAHLYLQAQQALRHQYQQVAASGLHNGLEAQHAAAAAAGINPALAPLMMMSHPALFSGTLPPSSVAMLNHINQFAQSHSGGSNPVSNAAAAAVAQIAASGGSMHQQAAAAQAAAQVAAAAQSAAQASLAAAASAHNSSSCDDNRIRSNSVQDDKDSDCEEIHTPRSLSAINHVNSSGLTNGIGSDGCASPHSSISSTLIGGISDGSDNGYSMHSDSPNSNKDATESHETNRPSSHGSMARDCNEEAARESNHIDADGNNDMDTMTVGQEEIGGENVYIASGAANPLSGTNNSSMQTLLTNIQGLLKVAADNARLQEKHSSFEISDLKSRMTKERQMRGTIEKKLQESERIRLLIQKRLKKERKMRKVLQEQLHAMQRQLGHDNDVPVSKIATAPTTPITGTLNSGRGPSISPSSSAISNTMPALSHPSYLSPSTSPIAVTTPPSAADVSPAPIYTKMPTSSGSSPVSSASVASPTAMGGSFLNGRLLSTSSAINSNNSSNIGSLSPSRGSQLSPFSSNRRSSIAEQEITLDLAIANRDHVEHPPIPDARLYFSNASRYQTTASQ